VFGRHAQGKGSVRGERGRAATKGGGRDHKDQKKGDIDDGILRAYSPNGARASAKRAQEKKRLIAYTEA